MYVFISLLSGIPNAVMVFSLFFMAIIMLLWRFYRGIFKKMIFISFVEANTLHASLQMKMWNIAYDAISLSEFSRVLPLTCSVKQGNIDEILCSNNVTVNFEKGTSNFTIKPLNSLKPSTFLEKRKNLIWVQIIGNDLLNEVIVRCEKKFGFGIYHLQLPIGWLIFTNCLGFGVYISLLLTDLMLAGALNTLHLPILSRWFPVGCVLLAVLFFIVQEILYKRILTRLV